MKKFYISLVLSLFVTMSWSQEYLRMISAGNYTVQEIQEEAEAYFAVVGTQRGTGFNPYKRWEYQALRNMDENGMLKTPDFYFQELENYNNYINQNFEASRTTVGTWEQMGPTSWNDTSGWNPGVGRITSISIQENDTNHIIVGANTGGVWRSYDAGATWTVLTDNMSNLDVYSLTIDPITPSTYYWGSSSGVIFKSTDSGATWNILADVGSGSVNKILVDPTNSNKMFCSVQNGGIFKSTNAGSTWSLININATTGYDIEFKPGNTSIIYASGNQVFKSTNGGTSFTMLSGFSNGPKMIGVSPGISAADKDVVYVLEANGGAFGALYKSTDSGDTFSQLFHTGKNYFGYSSNPEDPGDVGSGQAPRDMDIAINTTDIDDVHIAGINTWRSVDGGVTFNITSQWTPGNANAQNIGYCHADVDIMIFAGNKLYVGTDGGVYVADDPTTVTSNFYRDLTNGLGIRQFYKIGVSQTNPVVVSGGSQDNGTSVLDVNGNWTDWLGADGMETFVDKNNTDVMYGTSQFGSLYKTSNGGLSLTYPTAPEGKGGQNYWNWVVPFEQDPITPNTIYVAFDKVYKSDNGGATWTSISQNLGGNIDHLKIAPSSSSLMYASINGQLYKNPLVGILTNWNTVNGYSGSINAIAIHPTNPSKVAIATNGAQKVYVTENGGTSWTSYLYDLPNFTALALAWHDNGEDGLYVGMNYGVYYIDNTTGNSWQPFSNNLPNVEISELEVNAVEGKLYAGTYGRGLWRSNLYDENLSVNEFALNTVTLYPNPAKKEVSLSWDKNEDVSVRVYNSLGKLMYYLKDQSLLNPLKIDISQFSSGLYFVKINNSKGEVTKKLIVQ